MSLLHAANRSTWIKPELVSAPSSPKPDSHARLNRLDVEMVIPIRRPNYERWTYFRTLVTWTFFYGKNKILSAINNASWVISYIFGIFDICNKQNCWWFSGPSWSCYSLIFGSTHLWTKRTKGKESCSLLDDHRRLYAQRWIFFCWMSNFKFFFSKWRTKSKNPKCPLMISNQLKNSKMLYWKWRIRLTRPSLMLALPVLCLLVKMVSWLTQNLPTMANPPPNPDPVGLLTVIVTGIKNPKANPLKLRRVVIPKVFASV